MKELNFFLRFSAEKEIKKESANERINFEQNWSSCPEICKCNEKKKEITCSDKTLDSFPDDLPSDVESVIFVESNLREHENVSYLLSLKKLDLSRSQVQNISKKSFRNVPELLNPCGEIFFCTPAGKVTSKMVSWAICSPGRLARQRFTNITAKE